MTGNDHAASAIHAGIFGVFCVIIMMAAIMFIAAQNNQAPTLTDTYGNAQSAVTNQSQGLAQTMAIEGDYSVPWIVLLVVVIFIALVLIVGGMLLRSAIGT